MSEQAGVQVTVTGVVQGVGFRYFVRRIAQQKGLKGFVRNLPDGSVECYAEGQRDLLNSFVDELKRGPLGAEVDQVAVSWQQPYGAYCDFQITF